jgi:gliding motility-associated-like protein
MKPTQLYTFLTLMLLAPATVFGQIVNGEAFLQGTFLEVGVSACGSYGSNDTVPGGYQTFNNFNQGVGFVADPDRDGWGVGNPAFCGDYFLPGDPEEGFTIQIGGTNFSNNSGGGSICSSYDFPGSVANYSSTSTNVSVEWNGIGNGLQINQLTYFSKDSLYFTTKVVLTNISGMKLDSIFYMRNVDPDNEHSATNVYTTDNVIHYQNPSLSNRALVYAQGTTHGCFLGLGSNDPRSRVTHGGFTNRDPRDIWYGNSPFNSSGTNTADQAISIAFNLGDLDTNETVCFYYAYILDSTQLDDAINTTTINPKFIADSTDITSGGFYLACSGDSVHLSIQQDSGFEWSWSPALTLTVDTGTSTVAFPTATTMYTVTGRKDCSFYGYNFMIMVTPPPTANLGPDVTICEGDDVTIFANSPGSDFLWSTGDTTDRITVSDSGEFWVIVTNCNLSDTDTMQVFKNPSPIVDLGPDTTFCDGPSLTLDAGNPGATYAWNTFANTQSIQVNITNAYVVTVTAAGCSTEDTILVTVDPNPVVDLGDDTSFCQGSAHLLDAGNPGSSYLWSTGATSQTISVSTPNTYWVIASINACSDSDTMNLGVDTPPVVSLRNDTSICNGEMVNVNAGNPGMSYVWSTGDTDQTISVGTEANYIVTVTNGACVRIDSFDLTVIDIPIIDLGDDTTFCFGHTQTVTAPAGYAYTWSTGATTESIDISTSGTYIATASNLGCVASDTIQITVNPNPVIDLGPNVLICSYESITLEPGTFKVYDWSTGDVTPSIEINEEDDYWLVVTDDNDCVSDTSHMKLLTEICECAPSQLFLPNAFTPHGVKNNIFYPRGTDNLTIKLFQVYNRWGEVIFEARDVPVNDILSGWDGTYKGAVLPPQVFAYLVQAECWDGTEVLKKGNITLLK